MSSALEAELAADQPDDEVAWRDGGRMAARLVRSADAPPVGRRLHRRPVVRPGGGYVITGGYGSIGLAVARWLADRGAGRIVLGGRSGPSGDARKLLDELTASSTEVLVVRGDIAQPGVAEQLVATATAGSTPLCGVVHAAGVRADALIADLTATGLSKAWAPKVTGAWRLHEATEAAELDWFVLCSSAAALLGSPGQAGYAAANAWLDGFAAWRRANGLPATSVNWGLWSETAQSAGIALAGIDPIGTEEGIEALEALLAEEREAVGVIRLDTAKAAAAYPEIAGLPFFGQLFGPRAGRADAGGSRQGVSPGAGLPQETQPVDDWPGPEAIRDADLPQRSALVGDRIRLRAAAVLGVSGDGLAPDLPLTDAGLDSLAAVRVANLLARDLGVSVDPALLLGGATITGLQKSITAALEATADRVAPRDAAERQVTRVVAGVLAADSLGVTDDLRLLGLTEAEQVEISARLTAETGHRFDVAVLFASPTPAGPNVAGPKVASMAEVVRHAEEAEAEAAVMIRELRPGGARPPLILAHPAGGTCGAYLMLAGLLDQDRPILGLERIEGGVQDRAARYAAAIRDRYPDGGWVLGGWSFGGVLGYETARQLTADGGRPGLVVLLDAALPLPVAPAEEAQLLARRFAAFAEYLTRTYGRPVPLTADELLGLDEDAQLSVVTERMTAAGLTAELSPAILRHQQTSHEDTRALERYRADPYHGPVVLYRATGDTPWLVGDPRYEITDEARGWRPLCDQLEVVPVDAHHLNLLDPPAVHAVAAHLRALLTSQGGER
jgi:phthiocerol/phenolphthiocerol synthesis type-I polyketide synthase D